MNEKNTDETMQKLELIHKYVRSLFVQGITSNPKNVRNISYVNFCTLQTIFYLPEWLEKLHKLNKAHRAVRDHEVLEASEAAFTTTMPWPAAPRPEGQNENVKMSIWMNQV